MPRAACPRRPRQISLPGRRHVRQAALPQIERRVAVIIGVDEYQDKSIPQLGNAVKDAQAVGKLFETNLGYETVVIPNASKAAVIGALNRLALAVGPKDSVVIYYAGHGDVVEATSQGYWDAVRCRCQEARDLAQQCRHRPLDLADRRLPGGADLG